MNKLPSTNLGFNRLGFDNSFVYLSIRLTPEGLTTDKSEKFRVDSWLAIPKAIDDYQYEHLRQTFEQDKPYTQAEIEEKFLNLIEECNEKSAEVKPNKYFRIAVEWILPSELLSEPIDCWQYHKEEKTEKIGCVDFYSVHIRSSQRLHSKYRHFVPLWQEKWKVFMTNWQNIDLSHYLLACECNKKKSEKDLKILNHEQNIIGINFPTVAKFSYDFIIESGIPLALWSRTKRYNGNHVQALDELINKLINPSNNQFLNLQELPKSVRSMRLSASAKKNQSSHLGHHLCFLWENPYNYLETSKKFAKQLTPLSSRETS